MTNYSNYPRHRLVPNSCIICFSPNAYSWCSLTGSTMKYLLTNYIDGAQRIDLKDKDGTGYSMSVAQFRQWIETGSIPKERIRESLPLVRRRSGAPRCKVWSEAGQSILWLQELP